MRHLIKSAALKLGFEIRRTHAAARPSSEVVELTARGVRRGAVLISYIIEPFILQRDDPALKTHNHFGESALIAETYRELGYDVDIIDYRNAAFVPRKDYALFTGARTNFARIAQQLGPACLKIAHLDTAHWLFNNHASYLRGLALQQRRGVTVNSLRTVEFNLAVEYADYAVVKGSTAFAAATYAYAGKPLFMSVNPASVVFPWREDKDYHRCRKNFLWLGSGGLVHKGLDLTLEAFAALPECHLFVCGPVEEERHFARAYENELYGLPNIHTFGWMEVGGPEFADIAGQCIGMVYPSCSEGMAGSVVNCMQAGLIPLVSYQSGVAVEDFGTILHESSVEEITAAVRATAALPVEELRAKCRRTWEYARQRLTRERFAEEYRETIDAIVARRRAAPGRRSLQRAGGEQQ